MADAPTESTPRPVGRNEKQYQKLLDDYLGPVSGVAILLLCLVFYRFPMELSERVADRLALNDDEQSLIIPPLAALLDKQHWSSETRDRILQSGDWAGLALGLASYGVRVVGSLQEIKGHIHEQSRQNPAQQASYPTAAAGGNGHGVALGNAFAGLAQYEAT